MKRLLIPLIAFTLLAASCKPEEKPADSMKKIDATLKKLKKVKILSEDEALAMVKHALDPDLKRDYSIGQMSGDNIRELAKSAAFQQLYLLRGNDVKTDEPKTIAAIYFAPAPETPPGQASIRYLDISVCPPPDGSTCLKDHLDIQYP